jgi:eukaryotic-like serine/threonine-protein kinase
VSGDVIGDRFELRELLGRGGMSEVWLAEDLELGRLVALKLLAGDADPARLLREARAIAALSHPNIAGVYDMGQANGRSYIVLEYLPGGTLEERLEEGAPLPDSQTERVAREIAAGLAHAHAAGIVHRDLKPSNVLFDSEGRAQLADFGIARAVGQATITDVGTVMGTAAYLSPEGAEGRPLGPPADVYAFGVVLYRLVTGRLPFTGETALEVALKHQRQRPPGVRSLRPDAPATLAALVERSLRKSPEARPADGRELLSLLEEPATVVLPGAVAPTEQTVVMGAPAPTRRGPGRSRRLAAGLAAVALVGGGGVLAAVLLTGEDQQTPVRTGGNDQTPPANEEPPPQETEEPATERDTTTVEQTTTVEEPTTDTLPATDTTTTEPTTTVP